MRISDWSSDVCSSDLFLACCKENAVIGTKTQRLDQFRGFLLPVVLGDGAAGHAVLDIDIAKTRMTFATGPDIHVIEEFAAASARAPPGNRKDDPAYFPDASGDAETRGVHMLGHDADDESRE